MQNGRILVVGRQKQNAAIVAALIALGTNVATADEAMLISQRHTITDAWHIGTLKPERKKYGPEKKGRGGKVRRW